MNAQKKILVFDSHPVQYRVPIWQEIEKLIPGGLYVAYASDRSVKGYLDKDFSELVSWDQPLLEGYKSFFLQAESGKRTSGWRSLGAKGVDDLIEEIKPDFILLTGVNYQYDWVACQQAVKRNIPVWLRCENQDEANPRGALKKTLRGLIYKFIYRKISLFFYIGELNKKHYLTHNVPASKLVPALYGTVDRYKGITLAEKRVVSDRVRQQAGFSDDHYVIGFSGKFIDKKNPEILFESLAYIDDHLRKKIGIYFIGSGPLENTLKMLADKVKKDYGVKSYFAGFINQSAIGEHYLAIDTFILPSKRMGETWGLVVNEALQAGCAVVVSDAVGSAENFKGLKYFTVFETGNAVGLAKGIMTFSNVSRGFDWATEELIPYRIETTARTIADAINR